MSSLRCLDDSFIDKDLLYLKHAIRRLVIKSELTRSVDGYLIILGSLISEVEELLSIQPDRDAREVLKKVFLCSEVINALSPLTGHSDDVKELIRSSPRHRSLRPYLDIIVEVLNRIPLSKKELEVIRPPINELERTSKAKPELGTHSPLYIPVETTDHGIMVGSKREVVRRILGYVLLTILLIGISYFSYALLVKYRLIEPLRWIPLP